MSGIVGRLAFVHLSPALLVLLAACSAHGGGHEDEPTGSTSFAITSVPADVHCVDVTITGATRAVDKKYEVTPGRPSVYQADGLPTGSVVVSAQAFPGTCAASGVATWLADPQTLTLSSAFASSVTLALHPNGRANVSADFQQDNWTVSTYLGVAGTAGTTDGVGTGALFQSPWGLAVSGNHLYVQSWPGITRDVNLTTAATTTLATEGAASNSVVLGNALYITDWWSDCVDKLDLGTKAWTVLAGSGNHDAPGAAGWADGMGSAARFVQPTGITTDGASLYVTDGSGTIRKVDPTTGQVTTFAGQAFAYGAADGGLADARFSAPTAITFASGKLYVADAGNHDLRTIDIGGGTVKRLAGTAGIAGNQDGIGTEATIGSPNGIIADSQGNLYFPDSSFNVVRKTVIATGATITIAGRAGIWGSTDGPGSSALFAAPEGIAVDGAGNLYVSEFSNHTVRKLSRL